MNKKRILLVMIILIMLGAGAYDVYKAKTGKVGETPTSTTGDLVGKTYEQGLWDGFNRAFIYLDHTGQIKDKLTIEITIADSILHAK